MGLGGGLAGVGSARTWSWTAVSGDRFGPAPPSGVRKGHRLSCTYVMVEVLSPEPVPTLLPAPPLTSALDCRLGPGVFTSTPHLTICRRGKTKRAGLISVRKVVASGVPCVLGPVIHLARVSGRQSCSVLLIGPSVDWIHFTGPRTNLLGSVRLQKRPEVGMQLPGRRETELSVFALNSCLRKVEMLWTGV